MTDLIFNKDTDRYIYTGSRLRAGTTNNKLRLSSAYNESIIDLCNNGIVDISASSVFINGLKVVTTSNGNATSLTSLQLAQNLDVSGLITSDGGIQIGSGSYGGKIYKTANLYELVIDPFTLDASNNISDASGQVTIMGDLVVYGNTTTISSTNVDISDVKLTLASGGASGNVNGAGIELGKDGYASMTWNTTTQRWYFNKGIDISGHLLATGWNQIPTSGRSFTIKTQGSLNYNQLGDTTGWTDVSGWRIDKPFLSNYSLIKVEYSIYYSASPEAGQTLSFRFLRSINYGTTYDDVNPLNTITGLGSDMGVTISSVFSGSFYDNLNNIDASGNIVYYKLQLNRDCPANDTISTPFGVKASTSNNLVVQELYLPSGITPSWR